MAANNINDPVELVTLNKLLASKKSGPEKDKKIRDHYISLLNKKKRLEEQLAVVREEGFVLVLGDEDLKQQIADLKEQTRILQITSDTYKEDFEEERNVRAAAHGEKEELKMKKENLEQENRKLKQEIGQLKTQLDGHNAQDIEGRPKDGPGCPKCVAQRKEIQDLKGNQSHLVKELDHAQLKLVQLDSLKAHEKERDKVVHQLKQQLAQFQQRSPNSWLSSSAGHAHLSQAVGGARLPDQQASHTHHSKAATFPQQDQSTSSTTGSHGNSEEPPLRAKDPLVHSISADAIPLNQPRHYDRSHSPQDLTKSCGPSIGRQYHRGNVIAPVREDDFEMSGHFEPRVMFQQSMFMERAHSPRQDSNRFPEPPPYPPMMPRYHHQPTKHPLSQDEQVHHSYPGTHPNAQPSPGGGNRSPQSSPVGGNQYSNPSNPQHNYPEVFSNDRPDFSTPHTPDRVSPHHNYTARVTIPPNTQGDGKPRAYSVDSYQQQSQYHNTIDPLQSMLPRSFQLPLNTGDMSSSEGQEKPVYGNVDSPPCGRGVYGNVAETKTVTETSHQSEYQNSPGVRRGPSHYQIVQEQGQPPLPKKPVPKPRLKQSPVDSPATPRQYQSKGQMTSQSPINNHSSSETETPPPLPPKPVTYMNTSCLENYMPSELSVLDDPTALPRPPSGSSGPLQENSGMNGRTGVAPGQLLHCSVCGLEFGSTETRECQTHEQRCLIRKEERKKEWNQRVAGSTASFSQRSS